MQCAALNNQKPIEKQLNFDILLHETEILLQKNNVSKNREI